MGSFEELTLWQKSRKLHKNIFELVHNLPASEKFKLTDQIIRSSRSITSNMVEGHGRFHLKENIQFCRVARGQSVKYLIT